VKNKRIEGPVGPPMYYIFQPRYTIPKDIEKLEQIINNGHDKSANMLLNIDHEIRFHGNFYEMIFVPPCENIWRIIFNDCMNKRKCLITPAICPFVFFH
jgi:hypothetical protein